MKKGVTECVSCCLNCNVCSINMIKKIFLTFLFIILSLFTQASFAVSIPVEDVFDDIDKDYKYYHELQSLYDRGMIKPDSVWRFQPKSLLNRDEFVWILSEVSCNKCIQPDVSFELFQKYEGKKLFFDLPQTNKYFYCIASASDKWYVSGYHPWSECENGRSLEWEKPFCPFNTIILEEAVAIILRASWILTNEQAEQIRQDIYDGKITESLSDDVTPKNIDGSVYSFYPDLQKALQYEVVDVDADGNVKVYTLIELIDGKIRPKQAISKEDFLRIAYVAMKANSCEIKTDNNIAVNISVLDKTCNITQENCSVSDLKDDEDTYDFKANHASQCEQWVDEPEGYIWRFYHHNSWEQIKKYWKYVDNFRLPYKWQWSVYLRVIDKCWNTGEVFVKLISNSGGNGGWQTIDTDGDGFSDYVENQEWSDPYNFDSIPTDTDGDGYTDTIENNAWSDPNDFDSIPTDSDGDGYIDIQENDEWSDPNDSDSTPLDTNGDGNNDIDDADTNLSLVIDANPISWPWPLLVDFEAIVAGWDGNYSYNWDFWDGEEAFWNQTQHIFTQEGVYEVEVLVMDESWNTWTSSILIYVTSSWYGDDTTDSDWDGIYDIDDKCPLVSWDENNSGCPIFDKACIQDSDCDDGYYCSESKVCLPKILVPGSQPGGACEYSWWSAVMWNVVCNSCPCNNTLNFSSILRRCDIIFPAITSPDGTAIYGQWWFFQIK